MKMNKKLIVPLAIVGSAIVLVIALVDLSGKNDGPSVPGICRYSEMIFYYLDGCSWCNKVKNEGTIDKLEALGVKVTRINAQTEAVRHKFSGVPTFVINGEVVSGYKTFEDLKGLLGCPSESGEVAVDDISDEQIVSDDEFYGHKGEEVVLESGKIAIDTSLIEGGAAKFFNALTDEGKRVYFFIVKDSGGTYRAAANGCQVCLGERKGFRQEGDEMVCNNCGTRYPLEKVGSEKGGCNPAPISADLPVSEGKVTIEGSGLSEIADLF
jgi:glutaredoxin